MSFRKIGSYVFLTLVVLVGALLLLSVRKEPEHISYGASFNAPYAKELGLDSRAAYRAVLDDLGVRHLRLAAHWSAVEPRRDAFDFSEMDYQITEAAKRDAEVILGVGRRLPRWPECHVPEWAQGLPWDEQKEEIRELITATVERYKDENTITHWQVENEPYLSVFAHEQCGDLDEEFLKEEIALVRSLDGTRPILVTDSGNLGTWFAAYRAGDTFGTSMYVYLWNEEVGPFRSALPPSFYRAKYNLMQLLFGEKESFLIELSAEPWLLAPVTNTPLEVQLERMNPAIFDEVLAFAEETRFERQYLWGVEWWYWLKEQGESGLWERARELYGAE